MMIKERKISDISIATKNAKSEQAVVPNTSKQLHRGWTWRSRQGGDGWVPYVQRKVHFWP